MSGRILRKPASEDTFFLLEHLAYSPQTGECKTAYYSRKGLVLDQQGQNAAYQTYQKPDPPAFLTPIILHFDDGRMTHADAEKDCSAYNYTTEIHGRKDSAKFPF